MLIRSDPWYDYRHRAARWRVPRFVNKLDARPNEEDSPGSPPQLSGLQASTRADPPSLGAISMDMRARLIAKGDRLRSDAVRRGVGTVVYLITWPIRLVVVTIAQLVRRAVSGAPRPHARG